MPRWWLALGPPNNWRAAFDLGNIWGLKASGRPALMWEALAENDRLLFYVTLPIAGVVGYGTVRRKFRQNTPLWPDEVKAEKALWPLRFEFDVDYVLPFEEWQDAKVASQDLRVLARGGFQTVEDSVAAAVTTALTPAETVPAVAPRRPQSLHDRLKDLLFEAGSLQHFLSEKEYRMDGERLDVVWRRVERSVPTYAFEVQIGGDLYHALGKLKHAFDIWNSRIFLVAREQDRKAVDALLSGTFHEIRTQLRFIEVERLQEIYNLKKKLRDLEQDLGLL